MNIFELSDNLLAVYNTLEENEGELTPELEESLNITREAFNNKVKDYSNLIKYTQSQIQLIDFEIERLSNLKKVKKNIVDRLTNIIKQAINTFGDTSKSGAKFIDYGTGKISIRRTKAVSINNDVLEQSNSALWSAISYLEYINKLDVVDGIDTSEILNILKDQLSTKCNLDTEISKEELEQITTKIEINIPILKLLNGEGYKLLKEIVKNREDISKLDSKSTCSKTDIKKVLSENGCNLPNLAELVTNESLIIK